MLQFYLKAFVSSWEMLLDLPVPALLTGYLKNDRAPENVPPSVVLSLFPVVGMILGLAIVLFAWIMLRFSDTPAVAVIASLFSVLFLEYISSGRNLSAITAFIELTAKGAHPAEVAEEIQPSIHDTRSNLGILVLCSFFLVRICSIGLLIYYNRMAWIIVALILAYTVQSDLAVKDDIDGEPFFELEDPDKPSFYWVIAIICAIICGLFYLPFVLVAIVVAYLASGQIDRLCQDRIGGVNATLIGMSGYIIETLLLLLGLLFLVRI